jgi:nucleotide-binding universal stress UspA family protein
MTRSILLPLDGSRFAEAAIPLALELARKARASIHLIHAHEGVPAALGHGEFGSGGESDLGEERRYLAETAARLGSGSVEISFQLVDGPAVEALDGWIAEHRPALVVLATHGRGSLDPLGLGSVAEHLARCAAAPLLLVRPEDGAPLPPPVQSIRRILAPIDFAEGHEALVDRLGEFAGFVQAHVTLLHVVTPPRGLPEVPAAAPGRRLVWQSPAELGAQRWLDRLADRLRAQGVAAAARVEEEHDIGPAILEYADRIDADVVALHAHGCGEYHDGSIGPVVDRVIRGAGIPVLILPPVRPAASDRS